MVDYVSGKKQRREKRILDNCMETINTGKIVDDLMWW